MNHKRSAYQKPQKHHDRSAAGAGIVHLDDQVMARIDSFVEESANAKACGGRTETHGRTQRRNVLVDERTEV